MNKEELLENDKRDVVDPLLGTNGGGSGGGDQRNGNSFSPSPRAETTTTTQPGAWHVTGMDGDGDDLDVEDRFDEETTTPALPRAERVSQRTRRGRAGGANTVQHAVLMTDKENDDKDDGPSPIQGKMFGFLSTRLSLILLALILVVVIGSVVGTRDRRSTGNTVSSTATPSTMAPTQSTTSNIFQRRPTPFPTVAPSSGPGTAFVDKQELLDAVDAYVSANTTDTAALVASLYGRIDRYNVSLLSDFSHVFDEFRNPAMASFNANISDWDTSMATTMFAMFRGKIYVDT